MPTDTVTLHFDRVSETSRAVDADGALGPGQHRPVRPAHRHGGGAGSLAPGGSTAVAPELGLSIVEGGVILAQKELRFYSWGATVSAEGNPLLQDSRWSSRPVRPSRGCGAT